MKSLLIFLSLLLSFQATSSEWVPETEAEIQTMLDEWKAGDYKAFKRYKKKGLNPNFDVRGGRGTFTMALGGFRLFKYTKNHFKILNLLRDIGMDLNRMQPLGFQVTAVSTTYNHEYLKWLSENGAKLDLIINNGDLTGDFTALGGSCEGLGWNDEANEAIFEKLQFAKDELGYNLNENGLCSCRKFIPWEPEYVEEELLNRFPELEEANCN